MDSAVVSRATGILMQRRTLLVAATGVLLALYLWKGRRRLPPGPVSLPVVGTVLSVANAKNPFRVFMKWRKKYGDIVTMKIGSYHAFMVFGHDLVREALVTKGSHFAGRPYWLYIIDKIFEGRGVFWSVGERWKVMRRFALMTMRDFGVGKKSLEGRVLEEMRMTADEIEALKEAPFETKKYFAEATSNVICNIIFGARFEYSDERFQYLLSLLDFLFKNAGIQVPENFFPWLKYLPIKSPAPELVANDQKIREFVREKIEEHRLSFDPENPRDFVDKYLEVTSAKNPDTKIDETDMFRIIVDLFLAGSETTATSLRWWALFMATHPEVQERCFQEIDKLVSSGRQVELTDKDKLPYVVASLNEVLRMACIVPTTAPHALLTEVELGGYKLQPNDIVIFHIYASHMDEDYWDQPQKFNPDRWLGPDGKLIKHPAFFPFGMGPRSCMGEPLATMELFLFSSNLLQRFRWCLPPGEPAPSLEGVQSGITTQPQPHRLVAVPR